MHLEKEYKLIVKKMNKNIVKIILKLKLFIICNLIYFYKIHTKIVMSQENVNY
jgi:hypothetical protein